MSNSRPASHTPRNDPTWWERNTMPNSIDIQVVPKKVATRPLVSGMVESHRSPSNPQMTMTETLTAPLACLPVTLRDVEAAE